MLNSLPPRLLRAPRSPSLGIPNEAPAAAKLYFIYWPCVFAQTWACEGHKMKSNPPMPLCL
ncbi:hypothetical protein XELAEV_18019771mg [Xenopus laevis]|uniref:Uncharacterized protein n=1 Tax=Xenopus laevis TaxID=8355 RepID=A0A974D859_XENLA|nr:hypothetical protein XELAEV_18019771mg [Xenopus laevis]